MSAPVEWFVSQHVEHVSASGFAAQAASPVGPPDDVLPEDVLPDDVLPLEEDDDEDDLPELPEDDDVDDVEDPPELLDDDEAVLPELLDDAGSVGFVSSSTMCFVVDEHAKSVARARTDVTVTNSFMGMASERGAVSLVCRPYASAQNLISASQIRMMPGVLTSI